MHEMAIAASVIEQITGRLGATPIALVRLDIGELSGVVPDAIRFSFSVAAEGTSVAGAALEITEVAARCRCRSCGAEFRPADQILLCSCGSADVAIVAGEELRIASVGVNEHV
jgi:hydrogenase nickel incorporation protein HypA/HybF